MEFHATTGTTSIADGIIEEGPYFSPHGGKVSITGTGATLDMAGFFYDLQIATGASAELVNSIQVANNLDLDGPINADVNVIVLGNDAPGAISGSSGVYFSIGGGPIGLFIWLIGENTGTYTLPFLATTSGPVIPVEVAITTAGDGPDGALLFSCIELDDAKPQDLLGDGVGYYNATGGDNADYNLNRMWLTIASDYTVSPIFDLELSYTTADLSGISATEANLKAQVYDELHWGELLGTVNTTDNSLALTGHALPTDDRANFVTLVDNTSPNKSTYGGKTGLTCADAVELDSIDAETVFEMGDTVMWYKFVAIDSVVSVFINPSHYGDTLNFESLNFYSSTCSSVIADSNTFYYVNNKLLIVKGLSKIEIGETYNLQIKTNLINRYSLKALYGQDCGVIEDTSMIEDTSTIGGGRSIDPLCNNFATYFIGSTYLGDSAFNYVPPRKIKVVFHSFNPIGTNTPFSSEQALKGYAKWMIDSLNNRLANLEAPFPVPSSPNARAHVANAKIVFELVDSYLWYDDFGYNPISDTCGEIFVRVDTTIINGTEIIDTVFRYLRGTHCRTIGDSMYNTFITGNPDFANTDTSDVLHIFNSPSSENGGNGVWSSPYVIFGGLNNFPLLLHELGHFLGLPHVFSSGCIRYNARTSNNIMDYGGVAAPYRYATSYNQCQVMTIHNNINRVSTLQHKYLDENCTIDSLSPNFIINGGGVHIWNTTKHMDKNVIIKSGAVLIVKCLLGMPKDAKIIVENGAKLIVDGGVITNVCGDLWAGIEVWGTANLQQPKCEDCASIEMFSYADFGAVCIKNGAMIENAKNGVAAARLRSNGSGGVYHDLAYNGGLIHAENSTFRNNRNSVLFSQYNKIEPEIAGGVLNFNQTRKNQSSFVGCTFEIETGYQGPFYSFVGMWDVHGVTFEDNEFVNNGNQRGRGIISYNSEYSVQCETDVPGYYEPCKTGGHTNLFAGLDYGIIELSSNYVSLGGLVVKGAEFERVGNSITFSGTFIPSANLNNIDISTDPALPAYAPTAIYYNSVIGGRMYENNINTNYVSGNSPYGIVVNASSIIGQDIYGNTFEGEIGGVAMNAQNNNDYVVFKCNEVLDNMTNLAIYSNSSVAEFQGDCDFAEPADNTLTAANWNVFQSKINPNRFEYHHTSDGGGLKYTPTNNWFEPGFFRSVDCGATRPAGYCDTRFPGPSSPCGIYCLESNNTSIKASLTSLNAQLDNNNTQGLYNLIYDTGLADSVITDSLLTLEGRLSNNTILAMLYRTPQLDNVRMSSVLLNNYPHSSVVYREIIEQFPNIPADSLTKLRLYQDSSSVRKSINDSIFTLSLNKMANYMEILRLALPDTTVDMASIIDSLELETEPALRLILASLYEINEDYTLAKNIYDSIPLHSREMRDLIEYRQIAWNFASQGWNWQELDSTGESSGFKDDLEDLATGDSTAGAMYARNVLSMLNDSIYQLIYLFAEDTSSSKRGDDELLRQLNSTKEIEAIKILKVYPNPVDNMLTVEYELIEGQSGPVKFLVYNSMGQMVMESTLMADATKATFNMSEFNNGFYFYAFKCSTCKNQDGKFIILR